MANFTYTAGLRNVGSYQVSGTPWVTGSATLDDDKVHRISFPYVTKSITVINPNSTSGHDIRLHFQSGSGVTAHTADGETGAQIIADSADVIANNHYSTIPPGNGSVTLNVKCAKIYISNGSGTSSLDYQVFAELTQIPTGSMYALTGSGITE